MLAYGHELFDLARLEDGIVPAEEFKVAYRHLMKICTARGGYGDASCQNLPAQAHCFGGCCVQSLPIVRKQQELTVV